MQIKLFNKIIKDDIFALTIDLMHRCTWFFDGDYHNDKKKQLS